MSKPKVHRGRSKADTTPITIRLTAEEIEALDALADANLRTRTGQAVWLVVAALRSSFGVHGVLSGVRPEAQ